MFSLPQKEITEEGVSFAYEENGERLFLGPERSMEIQRDLGADIVMAFDECVEYPAPEAYVQESLKRTTRWAARCRQVPLQPHQFLFGIIQGGVYPHLREQSAREITAIPFDGFAIGGVSVGEGFDLMQTVVRHAAPLLPEHLPRYLMGVGLPEDLLAAVSLGMDMFDCVIPTRYARQGTFFTRLGKIRIMDKTYRKDKYPDRYPLFVLYLPDLFPHGAPVSVFYPGSPGRNPGHHPQPDAVSGSDEGHASGDCGPSIRTFRKEWLARYNKTG